MEIKMPRGDLRNVKFSITDSAGVIVTTSFDEIYITFKENTTDEKVLFQKKLTDDTITKDQDSFYHFAIKPEDTNKLKYREYVFDIELYIEDAETGTTLVKQTTLGKLILTDEVTFIANEGD